MATATSHAQSTGDLLRAAVRHAPKNTAQGWQERLFILWFNGLVYNQIWEDPDVDAEALKLGTHSRVLTISSAGCNILHYLRHQPASITAVDLNLHHLSVARLKLACMQHLPDAEAMFQFWGAGDNPSNVAAFFNHVEPHLDAATRKYWTKTNAVGRQRVSYFETGFYKKSRLGHLLAGIHNFLKAMRRNPERLIEMRDDEAGRAALFEKMYGRIFASKFLGWLSKSPLSVFNLGIPPEQFRAMQIESEGELLQSYRDRVQRLICAWSLDDNYFAWQALGRRYDVQRRKGIPPYLKPEFRDAIRSGLNRVTTQQISTIDHLAAASPGAYNAFVFLDSQDWMTPEMIATQWEHIARVGEPGSRIIFRTAARASPIETALPPELLKRFEYHVAESKQFYQQDRSAIYGGFHLYSLREIAK